jgi:hypothetical protein
MADSTPGARPRRARHLAYVAFAILGVAMLAYYATRPPVRYGDGWEYAYHLESLYRHGSPDLRADDIAAANALFPADGMDHPPDPPYGYREARDGRRYGSHFWAYSLSAIPAKAVLRELGGNELGAFQVTNAAWFLVALGVALFGSSAPLPKRLALAGLASVGPAVWYVAYTGAEVYSCSLGLLAMVALDNRRHGWAAAAAGLGALQNPPLVFLAAAITALAAWRRQWRSAVCGAFGTALAFLPPLFYLAHFGTPSLIGKEAVDVRGISLARTWGLAADLNQGMLPYMPLLLVGAIVGSAALLRRKEATAVFLLPAVAGMWVAVQLQANWNGGCLGMMRYLLWIVPALAWLAAGGLQDIRAGRLFLVVAVAVQGLVMVSVPPARLQYLTHGPTASWVLIHAPRLYDPEPEIFIERVIHTDTVPPDVLPVGFARPSGYVTKLLIDAGSVDRVADRFTVAPDYLPELRRAVEGKSGPVYVHPPRGKVWAQPKPEPDWLTTR